MTVTKAAGLWLSLPASRWQACEFSWSIHIVGDEMQWHRAAFAHGNIFINQQSSLNNTKVMFSRVRQTLKFALKRHYA